ncbi:phosphatidate cytidylyltransferase [Desulfovibrio subterraneus]|jgi:phosphatidate cytidylyltransferase|uniref:Phosphatidate cytidylyltransferase n=1 Tax=Desulfovibrio subterraneus TaxID=2718620 RepID=A0A7J0BDM5_9BACT|nr:phosphatidate cytidylyltransferase [Desulfovibrio subterraneus]WBF68621.1 phosphatidate cytidylyltransferase [Desulfovibrio subterraneus]GFM31799.1 phosphatidate cytidylyltransferase [Desulfovibrio subterraneus]
MTDSHKQRWITSLVVLPFLIISLLLGGRALFAATLIVAAAGQYEFYSMFWPGRRNLVYKLLGCLLGAGVLYGAHIDSQYTMLACITGAFWMGAIGFLVRYGMGEDHSVRFEEANILTAGILYLPLVIQIALRLTPVEAALVLLACFASDIGGFYTGCKFGKHKIWPTVSPKKTWEGSLGGMTLCMIVCLAIGLASGSAPWWAWLMLGLFLNIASQCGDFFESALKRTLGVKDSGTLLPGHGGILDRIDSILLALPAYALARAVYTFF